jgi:hypothetical protein
MTLRRCESGAHRANSKRLLGARCISEFPQRMIEQH